MHIAEGVLSAPVLAGGVVLAAAGVGLGLRKMDQEQIPRVAVLSAAFFVASLIHLPLGPTSVHLILNGLMGIILGWAVFPALAVALFLQAILFGFGGLTSLGVNITVMATPAVLVYFLFGRAVKGSGAGNAFGLGCGAGVSAIAGSCLLLATSLYLTSGDFMGVIKLALAAHLPVMAIEGLITGAVVVFLRRVRPEVLAGSPTVSQDRGGLLA
ncbi:MAG: cobalt transporter CbiM [Deltaproteobacteria bacterium]|nr:cobalt transporter CbiM [Deltaproteobacteria bacterium]